MKYKQPEIMKYSRIKAIEYCLKAIDKTDLDREHTRELLLKMDDDKLEGIEEFISMMDEDDPDLKPKVEMLLSEPKICEADRAYVEYFVLKAVSNAEERKNLIPALYLPVVMAQESWYDDIVRRLWEECDFKLLILEEQKEQEEREERKQEKTELDLSSEGKRRQAWMDLFEWWTTALCKSEARIKLPVYVFDHDTGSTC